MPLPYTPAFGNINQSVSSWLLYENEQYNAQGGQMLWTEGIRGCMNIDDLDNTVSKRCPHPLRRHAQLNK